MDTYSLSADKWLLDKNYIFLNHGSFGACPKSILDFQAELRTQMEQEPVRFFMREMYPLYDKARTSLANLLHVSSQDLVFVRNATEGVNTVLHSMNWKKGEHIVFTNHVYPACRNAILYYAQKYELETTEIAIPFPFETEQEILQPIIQAIQKNTTLLLIDHIASPTAFTYPVEKLRILISNPNVKILVDGAHAPGSIPLKIEELDVDFYTGNCHKWLCAPKGAGFLWVKETHQNYIYPLCISLINLPSEGFSDRFYWTGTADFTAFLSIPEALAFLNSLKSGGIEQVMNDNKMMNCTAREILCKKVSVPPPCPDNYISSMSSIPLPADSCLPHTNLFDPLQEFLYQKYSIEIPVINWPSPSERLIRFSCHAYNTIPQYEILGNALLDYFNSK